MQIKNKNKNKKLPWYYALRWRRKFYLGNRDPEPILVLVGKSDVEVERTTNKRPSNKDIFVKRRNSHTQIIAKALTRW